MPASDRSPGAGGRPGAEPVRHAGGGPRQPARGSGPGDVPGRRRGPSTRQRALVVVVALVAIAVPYSIALTTIWARTGDELDGASAERDGTAALRPLVALLAATADAQSAAVSGAPVDTTAVREAVRAMDTAQDQVGERLASARRWRALRLQVDELLGSTPDGAAAYTQFSTVVDGELALATSIGDASRLVLDPRLDSSYLSDTALLRIPAILVDAGRAADLTWLDEHHRTTTPTSPSTTSTTSTAPTAPTARTPAASPSATSPSATSSDVPVAVAVDNVRRSSDALDAGLRKGFASTSSSALGAGLLSQLAGLQNAVAQLAPPLAAVGATPSTRSARDVQAARTQVSQAALQLEGAALDQLAGLLVDRQSSPENTRRLVVLSTLAGLVLAGTVAWVFGPRRATTPAPGRRGAPDVADGSWDDGRPAAEGPETGDQDVVHQDLLEAHELLAARRLIRVGRAVTSRPGRTAPPEQAPPAGGPSAAAPSGGTPSGGTPSAVAGAQEPR